MQAGEFERALNLLVEAHPGAKPPSIAALRKYLETDRSLTVEELARRIAHNELPKKKASSRSSSPQPLRETVVREHSKRLAASGSDEAAFETALDKLQSDDRVRVAELKQIVREYAGGSPRFRSKAAGYEAIRSHFVSRALSQHSARVAEKAMPW